RAVRLLSDEHQRGGLMTVFRGLALLLVPLTACSTAADSRRPSPQGAGGSSGGITPGGSVGSGGSSMIVGGGGSTPGGEVAVPRSKATCLDFPPDPIVEPGVPPNAPGLFGDADRFTPGSVCLLEPQVSTSQAPGALFPANWLRPRFRFSAPGDLF